MLSCYLWCHVTLSSKYWEAVVGCPVLELSSVHLGVLRGENGHRFTPFSMITLLQLFSNYQGLDLFSYKCQLPHENKARIF